MISIKHPPHDVNFTIQLPFYTPPGDPSNPRFVPSHFRCHLFYNPANDNCVLVSQTGLDIYVTCLDLAENKNVLEYSQSQVIGPGLWRTSMKGDNRFPDQHLVDVLILRRRFTVDIHESPSSTSTKRPSASEDEVVVKRQKAEDTTEILISQTVHPVTVPSAIAPYKPATSTPATPARALIHADSTPLRDLMTGELAIIRISQQSGELGPFSRPGRPRRQVPSG